MTVRTPLFLISFIIFFITVFSIELFPCTRVVYQGPDNTVLTARSMDWKDPMPADLWIFPQGIERNGGVGKNSVKWKSKYGSVISSSLNVATSDGMNEKGLVANMLWLVESKYAEFDKNGTTKGLAISIWAQYVLDNFATVDEAVNELQKEEFVIVSDFVPGSTEFATIHLSISDATGDNAILEYIDGKLNIHHSRKYNVMTNSPVFDKQLALNDYWMGIPGTIMLPGTNRAADRFVRASYYINAIPQSSDVKIATAAVFSVIRNCSVPFGISSETEPNISSTRWRTVSNQKDLIYYFENVLTPNVVWVDFKNIDFSSSAQIKKLPLSNDQIYEGEASGMFVVSEPFKFLGLE